MVETDKIVSLKDHFRSFASIIEFSNAEFYDGKLRLATNYDELRCPNNTSAGIKWIDVVGSTVRPPNGSAYNNSEIAEMLKELKRLIIDNKYRGSVGVVTPFRAQADRIREAIEQSTDIKEYLYSNNDFLVDTVNKFQGDERDVILFSPVISDGTGASAIGFLNSTGNLFNVAITRARAVLVVIGDRSYCASCGISYMEHFVEYVHRWGEQTKYETCTQIQMPNHDYPNVANLDQVSEWEKILYSALYEAGIKTTPQYPVDKYHLDLALFHGTRKLDIEVDGRCYHEEWNGELCYRDQIRNQRIFELGWDIKRFWVYQVIDELPWCVEQIRKWLKE